MKYKTLGKTNLKVSRLSLGTARIGLSYGLDEHAIPPEAKALEVLERAHRLGINFFDTGNYYGLAEERLGKSGLLQDPNVIAGTKCAHFLEKGEYYNRAELESKIREQVDDSLKKLGINTLSILMLHGPNKEQIEKGELTEIMEKLRRQGKVRYIGASTRGEEAALAVIASGRFDVIQIAYSILDQRMAKKVLKAATVANIGIVNRSILLKGALTPLWNRLPKGLEQLQKTLGVAQKIAESLGMDLPSLAIRFAVSNPLIHTSLIGTSNIDNLEKCVKASEAEPLPPKIIEQLEGLAIDDPDQIDPARWPKQ